MYAQFAVPVWAVGTAATAEAVSWVAGATTATAPRPVPARTSGRSVPRTVPGGTTSPSMCVGSPNRFSSSVAQVRVAGLKNCVVVAFVNSTAVEPHRHQWKKPGISNSRSAWASSSGVRWCDASSW